MFELFIALFGGLYYGNKYTTENSKLKAYDQKQNIWQNEYTGIKFKYGADYETEQWAKEFVASGKHYDEICNWFSEEFRYVFGDDWRKKLVIPTPSRNLRQLYGNKVFPWSLPCAHVMWVYHLLLAQRGKIDDWAISQGYPVGGIDDKDMTIKFAKCIEARLLEAGVYNIRLALELDTLCGIRNRMPNEVCGGNIKIESLCHHPTHRLW